MEQGEAVSFVADPAREAPAARNLAVGLAVVLGLLGAYLLSALVFSDLSALLHDEAGAFPRTFRFNLVLILLIGFEVAALRVDGRASSRDFAALSTHVEAAENRRAAWRMRLSAPSGWTACSAMLGGILFGVAIDVIGTALGGGRSGQWIGHVVWIHLLNPLQFAVLALLALTSLRRTRLFSDMGKHVRVRLLDRETLKPFARMGLRSAAYWLVGSSVASLLAIDSNVPFVVYALVAATLSLGFLALLLPSWGIHQLLREAKRVELGWLRHEIEAARGVLADPAGNRLDAAARLPALLAYESRVERVSAWPFDVPTLVRFGFFVLLGLGSWLGGALVERLVDSALR